MNKHLLIMFAATSPLLLAAARGAVAQEPICGAPPSLSSSVQTDESIKEHLKGQADFLSKLVGKAELEGQVEAAKKQLYQTSEKFFAVQKDAYLSYLFCVIVMQDKSLSTSDKLKSLQIYKNATPSDKTNSSNGVESKQTLVSQYKSILKEINYSISLRRDNIIPALETYINDSSETNWQNVLWGVSRLKEHIERILVMAFDYDANFFNQSGELVSFVDFVDKDTPKIARIEGEVFVPSIGIYGSNAATTRQIVTTTKLPTKAEALRWKSEYIDRVKKLGAELDRLVRLLEPN